MKTMKEDSISEEDEDTDAVNFNEVESEEGLHEKRVSKKDKEKPVSYAREEVLTEE
jgi:hypothetical protein